MRVAVTQLLSVCSYIGYGTVGWLLYMAIGLEPDQFSEHAWASLDSYRNRTFHITVSQSHLKFTQAVVSLAAFGKWASLQAEGLK